MSKLVQHLLTKVYFVVFIVHSMSVSEFLTSLQLSEKEECLEWKPSVF